MMPFSVRQVDLSTFHSFAAACSSMSRAAAPALRIGSHEDRTLELPPVPCIPNAGLKYSFAAGANSVLMVFQSQSSSSAAIMHSAVRIPCPISDLSITIVTASVVETSIQTFRGAGGISAAGGGGAPQRPGKKKTL